MKRPVVLIVGAAAGALLVAAVGASAHSGFTLTQVESLHSGTFADEATGARTEPADTPEPTDTPKVPATAEPTDTPEAADTDTEANDGESDTTKTQPTGSGEQDGGGDHESSGGGGSGD